MVHHLESSHGQFETLAPVRAFVPYTMKIDVRPLLQDASYGSCAAES